MYYVIKGETTFFVARGPKELIKDLTNLESMDIRTFDYDDSIVWIDDALRFERRRVQNDPYAMTALDAEKDRRTIPDKNQHAPWFDHAAEMVADFSMALEEERHSVPSDEDDDEDDWDDDDDGDDDDLTPIVKIGDFTTCAAITAGRLTWDMCGGWRLRKNKRNAGEHMLLRLYFFLGLFGAAAPFITTFSSALFPTSALLSWPSPL